MENSKLKTMEQMRQVAEQGIELSSKEMKQIAYNNGITDERVMRTFWNYMSECNKLAEIIRGE